MGVNNSQPSGLSYAIYPFLMFKKKEKKKKERCVLTAVFCPYSGVDVCYEFVRLVGIEQYLPESVDGS